MCPHGGVSVLLQGCEDRDSREEVEDVRRRKGNDAASQKLRLGFLLGPLLNCIPWGVGTPFCIHQ